MSTFVLVNFVTLFWCHLIAFIVLCGYNEFDVSKRLQDSHYPQNSHYQWDSHHPRRVTILWMVTAPKLKTNAKMNTISYLSQNDHSLSLGQWPIVTSMVIHLYHDGHPPSPKSPRLSTAIQRLVTHPSIQPPSISRLVTYHPKEGHQTSKGQSPNIQRTVTHLPWDGHPTYPVWTLTRATILMKVTHHPKPFSHKQMHTHKNTHKHTNTHTNTHTHTLSHTHTHTHTLTHTHTHTLLICIEETFQRVLTFGLKVIY